MQQKRDVFVEKTRETFREIELIFEPFFPGVAAFEITQCYSKTCGGFSFGVTVLLYFSRDYRKSCFPLKLIFGCFTHADPPKNRSSNDNSRTLCVMTSATTVLYRYNSPASALGANNNDELVVCPRLSSSHLSLL